LQESRGAAPLLLLTIVLGLAGATLAPATGAAAAAIPPPARPLSFARDVAKILDRWCVGCHGGRDPDASLSLDSLAGVLRGGDAGPVVVPGDADDSLLVAKVEHRDRPSMPPRRRLPAPAIALIRAWIAAGAPP
jgi:hypothetical protein